MSISNLGICYEALQRTYRNSVVEHIRSRMMTVFPADYIVKVQAPFSKEWGKISASAAERRQTGELAAEVKDDFDLLGVNHFFNLFEAYFDDLCPAITALTPEQRKLEKQALLQWTKVIKNLRDPLSHPSEQDFPFEDAFVLLDSARRVLLKLGVEDAAGKVKEWSSQLVGRPLSLESHAEPLEDRLPPKESIVVDFVGRQTEIDELWRWFSDPTSRRWALSGEGGKGKSALAYRFATDVKLRAPEPYQLILWISAKTRRFEEGATVPIAEPDFVDLDSALTRILLEYGWEEEAQSGLEKKRELVLNLFDSFPALLIVDDADTLEGQAEDAAEFFTFYAPQTKTKVLLTSRRVLFGMGNTTTHIAGFNEKDGTDFVQSRCKLLELDPNLISRFIPEMIRVTEGSPLYLEDLLRLCSILPAAEAIRSWRDKVGDEARQYALGRELDMLSKQAKEVLVASCIPGKPVSNLELEALTGLAEVDIIAALKALQRLFLVPKPTLHEGEQRFNVNINTRMLVRKVLGSSEMYRRIESAFSAISGEARTPTRKKEIASAIRRATFLVRSRNAAEAEALLKASLERFPNDPDLLAFLGWVYKAFSTPRVTDARENFRRAWQLQCKNEGMYKHWSRMELAQGEWGKAAEAAERGLKLAGETRLLFFLAGYARGRLGKELAAGLHKERAASELSKAKTHLTKALKAPESLESGERGLNADIYRALVLACEGLGDAKCMREYFDCWRKEHPDDPDAQTEWTRLSHRFGLGT